MNSFRALKANEIDIRVGQFIKKDNKVFAMLLLYKDARVDMNVLDETVGSMNWKKQYLRDNQNCVVSIYDQDKKEWVSKEDVGTESFSEKEKGLASDSFKRACVNWGIGRELYTAPTIFVELTKDDYREKGDKISLSSNLYVKEIGYNESREINKLVIAANKNGERILFTYPKKEKAKQEATKNNSNVKPIPLVSNPPTDNDASKGILVNEYMQLVQQLQEINLDIYYNENFKNFIKSKTKLSNIFEPNKLTVDELNRLNTNLKAIYATKVSQHAKANEAKTNNSASL